MRLRADNTKDSHSQCVCTHLGPGLVEAADEEGVDVARRPSAELVAFELFGRTHVEGQDKTRGAAEAENRQQQAGRTVRS